MKDESATASATSAPGLPAAVDRATFQAELDRLMDLTVYGGQEPWEDSPPGWPQRCSSTRTKAGAPAWPPVSAWPDGRPIAQWPRLGAGHSDDLGAAEH
jgi:hypothetical protein